MDYCMWFTSKSSTSAIYKVWGIERSTLFWPRMGGGGTKHGDFWLVALFFGSKWGFFLVHCGFFLCAPSTSRTQNTTPAQVPVVYS